MESLHHHHDLDGAPCPGFSRAQDPDRPTRLRFSATLRRGPRQRQARDETPIHLFLRR